MFHQIKLSKTGLGQEWIEAKARHLGLGRRHFDALGAQLDEIDLTNPKILEQYLVEALSLFASALPKTLAIYFDNDFGSADFFKHSRVRNSKGKTSLRATELARGFRSGVRQTRITEVFVRVLQHLHRSRRSLLFRPTPAELRAAKCRSILIIGSELSEPYFGRRLFDCVNIRSSRLMHSLLNSPTVNSWKSYGLLRSVVPFCPLGYGMTMRWRSRLRELEHSIGLSADSLEYANAIVVLGEHNRENSSSLDALKREIANSTSCRGRSDKLSEGIHALSPVDLNYLLSSLAAAISDGKSSPPSPFSPVKLASPRHGVGGTVPSREAYELYSQLISLKSGIADSLVVLPVETRNHVQSAITRFLFELSVDRGPNHETEGKSQHAEQPLGPPIGEEIREIWETFARFDRAEKAEARMRFKEPSSEIVPTRGSLGERA